MLLKSKTRIILFILLFVSPIISIAQSIPVDESVIYDFHRRNQLLGLENSSYSFTIKPIQFISTSEFNSFYEPEKQFYNSLISIFNKDQKKLILKIMPIHLAAKFNSHHPVNYNDGAMTPSKGIQSLIRIGFFAKYGALTLQIQPEIVYANNKIFEGHRNQYSNSIDFPYPFNNGKPIKKIYGGQSSLRFNFNKISVGLSTENLWWGPGIHNSLLMSNSAAGFPHLTFNSIRPLKTRYGSFEFQLISGKLSDSGLGAYRFTESKWRYINALIISYQPKWIDGLFVGTIRSFLKYGSDLEGLTDYIPALLSFGQNYSLSDPSKDTNREHLESYFIRWIWEKSNTEIYLEYGQKENVLNIQEEPFGPIYNYAYILGFRKVFKLNKTKNSYIDLGVELTQLELNSTFLNNTYSWYEHPIISQGYTHLGQSLGAGIGPGSNLQTLDISWTQRFKKIGLRFERYLHNNDYFFREIKDIRANWVDLSVTTYVHWDFHRFLIDFQLKFVKSYNYQWVYYPKLGDPSYFWEGEGWDVFNLNGVLNISYRL